MSSAAPGSRLVLVLMLLLVNAKRQARALSPILLAVLFLAAGVSKGEDGVRLRAVDPKPFYRPGDRIVLEMRCTGAVTEDAMVLYNPTQGPDEGFFLPEMPRCPLSRFEIQVPIDFIGVNQVTAVARIGSRPYRDVFRFEVRSDAPLHDLLLSVDPPDEGCELTLFDGPPQPQGIYLFAVQRDGTRLDLCKGGSAAVTTDPPEPGLFGMKNGACTVTPKKPGAFRVIASYGGLRKEWTCKATSLEPEQGRPRPAALPVQRISPDEFLKDPLRFERHPFQSGSCRTVEHWDTGFCYVFTEGRGKVSPATDVRCTDVAALRERMERAIRAGLCDARPPEAAFVTPRDPYIRAGDLVTPRAYVIPASGKPGAPLRISIPAFRNDPRRLDRHPLDVGKCRFVEHHNTGYCYVYSLTESRKVSEQIDVRCTELPEQRRRMRIAIDEGRCGVPPAGAAGTSTQPRDAASLSAGAAVDGDVPARKTMVDIRIIATIVEAYGLDHNGYPAISDMRALAKLVEPAYMRMDGTPLADAWGTPLRYESDGKSYRVVSAGADRTFEPDSMSIKSRAAGETSDPAKDVVYSDGRFLQWPKTQAR